MTRDCLRALAGAALLLIAGVVSAFAQTIPGWETKQFAMERLDADRIRLMREVEVVGVGPNEGQRIFADDLLWNTRTGELSAEGNVVMQSKTGQISAERVVFNTKTGLGTFHTASGMASLGDRALETKSMFGGLEPDVYFYGEMIEKIGDDKYKIHHGGFTTCVQPTPRWDIVSGTATIDLEDYAVLRNAVLRVKDVPVFYLPIIYYPIQSDDRATGFLMPAYGNSTYQGSSISNAFFWAINRSQDVTLFHDWRFSRGQGMGSEYRYTSNPTSQGSFRVYRLLENATTRTFGNSVTQSPARKSFELTGAASQSLPGRLTARARVNYFSDLTVHQTYNYDFSRAVDGSRTWSGTLSGAWSGLSLNANYGRSEYFYSTDTYSTSGLLPSVRLDLSSRQIGRLPLFAAIQSEYSRVLNRYVAGSAVTEYTISRSDFTPTLRAPLSRLPFLTVNASATYWATRYSGSINESRKLTEDPLARRFFDFRTDVTGPVLTRVFSPRKGWADRIKHSMEPVFGLQHRTRATALERVAITSNQSEYLVGDTTVMSYGFATRLLVKPTPDPTKEGSTAATRELVSATIQQSRYSNPNASVLDPVYGISYRYRAANNYSPVSLTVRGAPTRLTTADFRMEYDTTVGKDKLLGMTIGGGVNMPVAQGTFTWNHRRFGANNVDAPDNFVGGNLAVKTTGGAVGGTFHFNYDLSRDHLVQHRWIAFYNTQCCGVVMEYQAFNYGFDPRFIIPTDRRFNLSFSLAGVGSFSNFFGAFGIGQGNRGY